MFLPTTKKEMQALCWDRLDVILVTGDGYIDSPWVGVAMIGKVLMAAGYRVGIIAQPDPAADVDIRRLGEPRLFWGVTGGCIDSMVANRTAAGKRRRKDDYTPGGRNDRRPDRAVIVYSNLIRRHFKNTRPIVLGGIEASLRRVAHYDFWSDKIRRSILFDAKADYLLYGMAEGSVLDLARCLKDGNDPRSIKGICHIAKELPQGCVQLPAYTKVAQDKAAFTSMFHTFYGNNDPVSAKSLAQKQDTRYLVQNPPTPYLSQADLDRIHGLGFEGELHPFDAKRGKVQALETIRFSIPTHRGCYGECSFCAIAVHQGRRVRWRSRASILDEARRLVAHPKFKGIIQDVGGPTANMYGFECARKRKKGSCADKRCLFPEKCPELPVNHGKQIELLRALRRIDGVRKVVVASGIRHDMVLADEKRGKDYLAEVVRHHVSGQMKIAPEHCEDHILKIMAKPGRRELIEFRKRFYGLTKKAGRKQYLTYYMIAAHPGCRMEDMERLKAFALKELKLLPKQVQLFTPTPSTQATLMYWTEQDPFSGQPLFVEKSFRGRVRQKEVICGDKKQSFAGRRFRKKRNRKCK
jgi:uncharacterized radical SAM protein YgiQ